MKHVDCKLLINVCKIYHLQNLIERLFAWTVYHIQSIMSMEWSCSFNIAEESLSQCHIRPPDREEVFGDDSENVLDRHLAKVCLCPWSDPWTLTQSP